MALYSATRNGRNLVEINENIAIVGQEAKLLAAAAEQAGLDVDIPTCPGWDMRELLRHLGEIHLWAAAHVAKRATKMWVDDTAELTEYWPELGIFWPQDNDLIGWYLDTNANLVHELASAPADLDTRTFLPAPSPLAMWARRQAHETAVHRFDAEHAAGITSSFDAAFAADGVDEILAAFAPRRSEFPIDETKTILVRAMDTDDSWLVTLAPDGITTTRGSGDADVTVSGPAGALYLSLWNRGDDGVDVSGDSAVYELWHTNHRIRWS